jgi:hypothetical protein
VEGGFLVSLENVVVSVVKGGEVKEKFMVNLPNIRNLQGFLKGEWDLSLFDSAFPKRNRLGDVDGSVEINGYTLHVEFKASKYSMNRGQVLKAVRQAKYSNITSLFVFGKTNAPEEYLLFTPDNLQPDYVPCDVDSLVQVMKQWSDWTNENNLVEQRTTEWELVQKYFGGAKSD